MEPQHRHSIDLEGLFDRLPANMIATAAATHRVAQRRRETEGAAPGWGGHPDAASRSGLVRPDINAKPGSILPADGQRDVTRRRCRRPPSVKSVGLYFVDNSLGVIRALSAGFRRALRAAQTLAPRGYAFDQSGLAPQLRSQILAART
jgi:hypothetical protein